LPTEEEDGTVVGFVMGELYIGEYGIFQEEAALDTIGVDPNSVFESRTNLQMVIPTISPESVRYECLVILKPCSCVDSSFCLDTFLRIRTFNFGKSEVKVLSIKVV
jgi:hypothetical protein